MDARLTPRGGRCSSLLCGILSFVLWAALAAPASGSEFQRVYDEAVQAQQRGDLATAAVKFETASRIAPASVDVLVRLALVRGQLREFDRALAAVDRGLRIAPRNTDLRLAHARILGWAGRYAEALRTVEAVIAEQPQNAEAYAIRGRIAFYEGRLDAADAGFATALKLEPGNAEAAAGRADVARARQGAARTEPAEAATGSPRWRIDAGYLHSRFSRLNLDNWHEGFIRVEHRWPSRTALSLRVDTSNRFGSTETAVGVGIAQHFGDAFTAYAEGSVSPAADFLPRWTTSAGGRLRVAEGGGQVGPLLLSADLRHKSYATGDIQNFDPGLELYGFNGRAWLTGRWINAFDREADVRLAGWFARLDWQMAAPFRVFAGFSDAPETEAGITVDTQSVFGGLAFDVTQSVRLNASAAREDRENSYIRNVFGVSLTLHF